METIRDCRRRHQKLAKAAGFESDTEVSSAEWGSISLTKEEEDLVHRMFRLVGERWDLIAGRIPGRTAEEIERFWIQQRK
ncbi:MYB-like transcription factor ETC1 [Morus notabilis]|nr:MYB-like transcription factor ETC1 [Morus notabilis]